MNAAGDFAIWLPEVNASLNSLTSLLLLLGWHRIRHSSKLAHAVCMGLALLTSTAFLASYLTYHSLVGTVHFTAAGGVRPIYFCLLISHTLLATIIVPMVIMTVVPTIRARFDKHRRIARWTLPLWLYVSATGVLVYFMLYRWFPSDDLAGIRGF